MRYGAMNSPLLPVTDEIDAFGAMGFDYLELTLDAPMAHYTDVRRQAAEIRRRLDRHGMDLVCHLPTFVSTADLTASIRRASVAEVIGSLEAAAGLGARKAVLHPPTASGLGCLVPELTRTYALESLSEIHEAAERLGVLLCVENMIAPAGGFTEPEDFTEIFSRFPDLRLTLDTGHANLSGRPGSRALRFIKAHGDRLGHIHASDNRGKGDDHIPVGSGNVPFGKIARAIQGCGYDETITLEIFTEDRTYLATSREKLAALF